MAIKESNLPRAQTHTHRTTPINQNTWNINLAHIMTQMVVEFENEPAYIYTKCTHKSWKTSLCIVAVLYFDEQTHQHTNNLSHYTISVIFFPDRRRRQTYVRARARSLVRTADMCHLAALLHQNIYIYTIWPCTTRAGGLSVRNIGRWAHIRFR